MLMPFLEWFFKLFYRYNIVDFSTAFLIVVSGTTMISIGIVAWIYYFVKDNGLILAILGTAVLAVGVDVCVNFDNSSILIFTAIASEIFISISGIVNLIISFWLKRHGASSWIAVCFMSALLVVFCLVTFLNADADLEYVIKSIGVGLLLYAVTDIITFVQLKKIAPIVNNKIVVDN